MIFLQKESRLHQNISRKGGKYSGRVVVAVIDRKEEETGRYFAFEVVGEENPPENEDYGSEESG